MPFYAIISCWKEWIPASRSISRRYRHTGMHDAVPGFCRAATVEEVRDHKYALTPGRYVGSAETEEDDEPFEEKMPRLVAALNAQFDESAKLERLIRENLSKFK